MNHKRNSFTIWFRVAGPLALVAIVLWSPLRSGINSSVSVLANLVFPEKITREESLEITAIKAQLSAKDAEIAELQKMFELKYLYARAIPAKVLLGGGFMFADVFLTDRGSESGVEIGDYAIYGNFLAVGAVVETGYKWSKVELFSAAGREQVLKGGEDKEIAFEAYGAGGGEIRTELPVSVNLRSGDPLWFGGDTAFLAGYIEEIMSSPGSQLQELIIKSPVAPARIERILILSK